MPLNSRVYSWDSLVYFYGLDTAYYQELSAARLAAERQINIFIDKWITEAYFNYYLQDVPMQNRDPLQLGLQKHAAKDSACTEEFTI